MKHRPLLPRDLKKFQNLTREYNSRGNLKLLQHLIKELNIDDAVKKGLQMNLGAFDKFVVSPILKPALGKEARESRYEKLKEVPVIGDVAEFIKEDVGPFLEETLFEKIARPILDPTWDRISSIAPQAWSDLLAPTKVRTGSGDPRFLDFWTPEGEKPGQATLQKLLKDAATSGPIREGLQQFVGETVERKPKPFGLYESPFDKFLPGVRAKFGKAITEAGKPSSREEIISKLESNKRMRDRFGDIKIPIPDFTPSDYGVFAPGARKSPWQKGMKHIPISEIAAEAISPAPTKFESDVINLEELEESKRRAIAMTPTGELRPDIKTDLGARELREIKTKDLTKLAPGIRAVMEQALFLPLEMQIPLASQLRYGKAGYSTLTGKPLGLGGLAKAMGTRGGGPIGAVKRVVARIGDELIKPVQGAEEIIGATIKIPISAYDKVIDTIIARRAQSFNKRSVQYYADAINEVMDSERWDSAMTLSALNQWIRDVPQVTPELIDKLKLSSRVDGIKDVFMLDDSGKRIVVTEGIKYPNTQQIIDYQLSKKGLSPEDIKKVVEVPKSPMEAMVGRDLSKIDTPIEELFITKKFKSQMPSKKKLYEGDPQYIPAKVAAEADPSTLTKQQIIDTVQEAFMNDPGRLTLIRNFLNKNYSSRVTIPGTKGQWRKENIPVDIFDEEVKRLGIPVRGGQVRYDPEIPLKVQETPGSIPVNEAGDPRYLVDDQAIPGSKEDIARNTASENSEFIAQLNNAKTYDDKLLAIARENIRKQNPETDWYEMDPRGRTTWDKMNQVDKDTAMALDNMEKEEVMRLSKDHFKEIQGQKMVKDPDAPKDTSVDQLELSSLEAQPENVAQIKSRTKVGRIRSGVENSKVMPMKHADDAGGRDQIYKKLDEMQDESSGFNGTRKLVGILNEIHDSTTQLRILQESYYKSKGIGAFRLGGSEDLVAMVTLAPQAPMRGYKRGRNHYETFIEPLIDEDVTLDVMNEYLAYSHFVNLKNARMQGNIPANLIMDRETGRVIRVGDFESKLKNFKERLEKIEIDPSNPKEPGTTLKVIDRVGDDFVTTDRDIRTAWDKLELSKMNMQKEYSRVVDELVDTRVITQRLAIHMREKYPNFNPSTYLLAEESAIASGTILDTVNFGEVLKRYKNLPDRLKTNDNIANADIVGAAAPLDAHIMYMMRHEVFMQKQKVNKAFVAMMKHHDNIQDVTEEFFKPLVIKQEKGVERIVTKHRNIYDPESKTGFISYYENSKPKIFGVKTVNPDGSVRIEPIDKSWYKIINGRGGLQSRSGNQLLSMVATTNSYFKSIYTTYDPVFMIGNSLIDSLVVALKYRIMPWTVYSRLLKSVLKGINRHDYIKQGKMLDILETKGGVAGRFEEANIKREVKRVMGDVSQGGGKLQTENALLLDAGQANVVRSELDIMSAELLNTVLLSQSTARALRRGFGATTGKVAKRLRIWNEAVEQAPRMAVAEKLLKKTMGRKEFNRLFGKTLSHDEYNKQVWEEWTPHFDVNNNPITPQGKGHSLIDSPEIGRAAMVALESTINFYRGGNTVRYLNNYIMFLNAAAEGFKLPFRALGVDFIPNMRPIVGAKPGKAQIEIGTYERTVNSLYTDEDLLEGGLKVALAKGAFRKNNSPFSLKPGKGRQKITNQYDAPLGTYKIPDAIKALPLIGKHLPDETDPKVANAFMAAMMTGTYAPIMWYNMQFAEYWDIPAYIRYNSLIVMRPTLKDENGNPITDPLTGKVVPRYFTLPHKTRELSIFFGGLAYMMETMFSDNPTDFNLWMNTVVGASMPLVDRPGRDRSVTSWSNFIPEVASIGLELYRGVDDYRDQPIVDDTIAHYPYNEQYTYRTSTVFRQLAQKFQGLPDIPGFEGLLKSPQRLEHLATSFTGGVGRTIQRPTDLILETIEELKRDKTLPIQIMAEKYLNGSYADRNEIKADLSTKDLNELMLEVNKKRQPEGLAEKFIQATGLDRFVKDTGGGLKEIAYEETIEKVQERTGKEISRKQTKELGKKLGIWGDQKLDQQKYLDSRLDLWRNNPNDPNGIGPQEWQEQVAMLNSGSYVGVGSDGKQVRVQKPYFADYPDAIQSQLDPEVKEIWYNNIYTAAGALEDDRDKAQILLSGYFSIKSPHNDPTKTWVQYYDERDEFMQRLVDVYGEEILTEFHSLRTQKYTPTQRAADNANRYLAKYFDLGSNIDDLYPDWKQFEPRAKEYWELFLDAKENKKYLKSNINTGNPSLDAEHNYRARIINKIYDEREWRRQNLVEDDARKTMSQYEIPLMDAMLVFWRGSKGRTPKGKQYFIKLNQGMVKDIPIYDMD